MKEKLFSYKVLSEITNIPIATLKKREQKGDFDLWNSESVALFIASEILKSKAKKSELPK